MRVVCPSSLCGGLGREREIPRGSRASPQEPTQDLRRRAGIARAARGREELLLDLRNTGTMRSLLLSGGAPIAMGTS